jgi:hypothetical protein
VAADEVPATLKHVFALWRGFLRLRQWIIRRLIWLAAFGLIAAGIVCLYLSDKVAPAGTWWQGTLDAFGVGFVVGGIVDVLAISLLNQVLARDQKRKENNVKAQEILDADIDPVQKGQLASKFVYQNRGLLGWELHAKLQKLAEESLVMELQKQWAQEERWRTQDGSSTTARGDASSQRRPEAPGDR